jgi:hypothetical protein
MCGVFSFSFFFFKLRFCMVFSRLSSTDGSKILLSNGQDPQYDERDSIRLLAPVSSLSVYIHLRRAGIADFRWPVSSRSP